MTRTHCPAHLGNYLANAWAALALSLALCLPAHAEDNLGRLFFTPERRQALDHQRQFNIEDKQQAVEDPTLTINGVVTRSSGKRTVWINGVAQNDNDTSAGVSVVPARQAPGRLVVTTPASTNANAKVGETVNRATGESSSPLGDGKIVIRPGGKVLPTDRK